jgi:hypothetical protein
VRALALGLLLTACIDWDAERRAALCLKDQICTGGGGGGTSTGGGSGGGGGGGSAVNGGGSAGGGTQTNGGGTASNGGGTVSNGGGTAQSGGGSSTGGGSSSNGGGTGVIISTDGGCSDEPPMRWCPLPGPNPYVGGAPGHPKIHLTDCGGGRVCFCASPTGTAGYSIGQATPDGGVIVALGSPAGDCHGIATVSGNVYAVGLSGTSEQRQKYSPGNNTASPDLSVPAGTVRVSGVAAWNSAGVDHVLATGASDAGFGWLDYGTSTANVFGGDTLPLTPAAEFFAPAVLPGGGAIVPYVDDSVMYGAVCGYVVLTASGATQPHAYVEMNAEAPSFAATTATSFYVLCSGTTYLHASSVSAFDVTDADLLNGTAVGVAATDDLNIVAVAADPDFDRIVVYRFAWDGGTELSSDYTHVPTEPNAESMTLLSDGQLVISAICKTAFGPICTQVGEAFIGFYNP